MKIALMLATGFAMVAAPALAQTGPIETRQALMKANGRDAKAGGDMLKGVIPFDATKAQAIFKSMNDVARSFGQHFPAGSQTGGDTEAAPSIWAKPAEFKAALAKFEKDTAAAMAAKPTTLAAFGQQFGMVAQNCKTCHETFRIKK
ncbi:c-type cytochrome [Polymorphobacter sp.]|uniref:c-type cytochrome n=1 Tax=Polymorphobacter sp. TaxID=1909290 RepID=UPI003F71BCDA